MGMTIINRRKKEKKEKGKNRSPRPHSPKMIKD